MGIQAAHRNHCQLPYLSTALILPNKGRPSINLRMSVTSRETCALRPLVWKDFVCHGFSKLSSPWHRFVSEHHVKKRFQVIPPQEPSPGQGNATLSLNTMRFSCQAKLLR